MEWDGVVKLCTLDDSLLVKKSKAGDLDAFEELVKRYEKKIYTLAFRYSGNYDDANDIAQNAFFKAYKSLPSFRGEASFATWLYRITANACHDKIRKQNKYNYLPLDNAIQPYRENPLFAAPDPSSGEYLERKELKDLVKRCLNSLSSDHRLILILREMYGLSYNELASCMGCSLNTVKVKLYRARYALKEKIIKRQELLNS